MSVEKYRENRKKEVSDKINDLIQREKEESKSL